MNDALVIIGSITYNVIVAGGLFYLVDKRDLSLWWLLLIPFMAMSIKYKKDKT